MSLLKEQGPEKTPEGSLCVCFPVVGSERRKTVYCRKKGIGFLLVTSTAISILYLEIDRFLKYETNVRANAAISKFKFNKT